MGLSTCFCRAGRGIAAEYFMRQSSMLLMKIVLMYLPHRKQNCRRTTAEVPLLGRIIFSKIVSQCFDKSFKLDPSCLAPHNDRLLPLQHNWDLMHVGKMCEVVDVQMDVNVVAMLLRCCCHSVERFCTHILLYRKRNCR